MKHVILDLTSIGKTIKDSRWILDYQSSYIHVDKKFCIRVVLRKGEYWYEVDRPFFMEDCYEFSSNDVKECIEYCNEEFGANIIYYGNM